LTFAIHFGEVWYRRPIIIAFAMILCTYCNSQSVAQGRVVDADTKEPLIYCHIMIALENRGTITNEDGEFELIDVASEDTLVVSYIGYHSERISIAYLRSNSNIELQQQSIELGELVIYGEDEYLYKSVAECRARMLKQPSQTSKVYFHLETTSEGIPLEMIQCYYNGTSQGCAINELKLKNGRVGLPDLEGGYYVSLNTTKAIAMFDIANPNTQFPANPLQMKFRNIKKFYDLVRLPSFSDQNTLHIAFTPKDNPDKYFSGELWIDKNTFDLYKIELQNDNSSIYPFSMINEESEIKRIGFNIKQTYERVGEDVLLDHMNFTYDLQVEIKGYEAVDQLAISTQGLLYFYEKNSQFTLPYFDYDKGYSDYSKISFFPYDAEFWKDNWGFKFSALQLKRLAFLEESGVLLNYNNAVSRSGFWTTSKILWSEEKRLRFEFPGAMFVESKVNNAVQLFLDVNDGDDSLRYTTAVILDIKEYVNAIDDAALSNCYLNIYFDIAEIERRDMMSRLRSNARPEEDIEQVYDDLSKELKTVLAGFERATRKGNNVSKLKDWNQYVLDHLGIDNMEIFNVHSSNRK